MLHLVVKIGQSIELPGVGEIIVKERSGRCVKLAFNVKDGQTVKLLPQAGAGSALAIKD